MAQLIPYSPQYRKALIAFWNITFAGRRNFRALAAGEWEARVAGAPGFDARGLMLAIETGTGRQGGEGEEGNVRIVGGVHALRPAPQEGIYRLYHPRHHIAWLGVAEDRRGEGIGSRLLQAAESWLYYCPVHFATESTPFYGTVEQPAPPLHGSSQRLGVSLRKDLALIEWLARRGYTVVEAGDVSMGHTLRHEAPEPQSPNWQELGLRAIAIDQASPWQGPGYDELRLWRSDGWRYGGTVLADQVGTAVARIVWCPLEAGSAAILRLDVGERWRGQGLASYLLDHTLHELSQQGYGRVEVQTHLQRHARAAEMYRRRGFVPEDAWANLVKH